MGSADAPLTVVVLVKYVPDPQTERTFTASPPYTLERHESALSELDEYAIEAAVQLSEERGGPKAGTRIVAVTMGPEGASAALKKALQMGAQEGVHLKDPSLAGSDAPATARALAALVRTLGDVDLVLCGMESTDAESSLLPGLLAAHLGVPPLTFASHLRVGDGCVRVERSVDGVREELEAALPALVSVTDQANHPRYPHFTSILAARKRPIRSVSLSEIGLDPAEVGADGSGCVVHTVDPVPERTGGSIITDGGDGGVKLVDFLASRNLLDTTNPQESS